MTYTVLFFSFLGAAAFSLAHVFTRVVLDRGRSGSAPGKTGED